ncbi:RNA polymerase II transcription factor SIII subunit A-domain-containing protein [Syncephalastrum racemosum]|uniref:RNA polymerase II transcription factor SIII subunit A-domain-containing protein n=1 Tax=Syncephalastrum racemosum TaxID=13706 RepID=A0A1X2HFF1_SYNRA|nr:RNA polymerase II transcription factor SIII subunit A-domain-containing protein [Syncephalastrum racemosum]
MRRSVKTLVAITQDLLGRQLDALAEVGNVPYELLKGALAKANPRQLYRIEKYNPHLMQETNELWLPHILSFSDIRDEYQSGKHQDPRTWRATYFKRLRENEQKRQAISEKIRSQYKELQNEKAARSVKMLQGCTPVRRTYEEGRRSTQSKLFQKTRKAVDRTHARLQTPALPRTTSAVARPAPLPILSSSIPAKRPYKPAPTTSSPSIYQRKPDTLPSKRPKPADPPSALRSPQKLRRP